MDSDSIYYVQATIAYFEKDIVLMKECLGKMRPDGDLNINISVIRRLILGLERYDSVDYKRDYLVE
jgi:hypothetical protein